MDDLAVGSILEREELDFAMFGRSKVRQYESKPPSKPNPTLYQEDFTLQSEDDLNQMESILNRSDNYNPSRKAGSSSAPKARSLDVDNLDFNAYISQQENDSNVSLFD